MKHQLSNEQIEAKARQLSEVHGCEVHPLVFIEPDTQEQVVGYIKEPNRLVKMRVLDKGLQSPITAASELLEVVLLKEESDERIYSERQEHDKIYLGAVMACYDTIKVSVNQFKKK